MSLLERVDPAIIAEARRHNPPAGIDTEDLIQEGRVAVWRAFQGRDVDEATCNAFATIIARRRIVTVIRETRWGRRNAERARDTFVGFDQHVPGTDSATYGDTIAAPEDDVSGPDVERILRRLTPPQRAAVLALATGTPLSVVADHLGVTQGRVSQHLSIVRKRLGYLVEEAA